MAARPFYRTEFVALAPDDTVDRAVALLLDGRISDLPVLDARGRFLGMFRVDRLLGALLPRAALLPGGIEDLSFLANTLEHLRGQMREVGARTVAEFTVAPEQVVHPDTAPVETVLLLYRGAYAVPVVERDSGRLVGLASARDVLGAIQPDGGAR